MGEIGKVSNSENETPALQIITGTQSLRYVLSFKKRSKRFFSLVEKDNGDVLWNGVLNKPLGKNRVGIKNNDFYVTPNNQKLFTETKITSKSLDKNEKELVYVMLNSVGFYENRASKGFKMARMQDMIKFLQKSYKKFEILFYKHLKV